MQYFCQGGCVQGDINIVETLGFACADANGHCMGYERPCSDPQYTASEAPMVAIKSLDVNLSAAGINSAYSFNESSMIGEGSFGKVYKGTARSGENYAIKHVWKANTAFSALTRNGQMHAQLNYVEILKKEMRILKTLTHANIIKLKECFEDGNNFYLVMELCSGGKLNDFITQRRNVGEKFTEKDCAMVMDQLLRAVSYVHSERVVHRDIKPENLLLRNSSNIAQNTVVLIDFGLACMCRPEQLLYDKCGSPCYMAPEVVEGRYGQDADNWSCGVTLFNLLSDRLPFSGATVNDVYGAVRRGNFNLSADVWKTVSDEGKEVIRGLMTFDPKERMTANQALETNWVRLRAPPAGGFLDNAGSMFGGSIFRR